MAVPKTRTIRTPIFIHASPRTVFRAITDPKLLITWFSDTATIVPRRGGSYALGWQDGPTHTGRVLELVPGKRITLSWQWPGKEALGVTRLRLSVEPKAGGTILRFTHSGFGRGGDWVDLYEGAIRGWTYFMMNCKSVVEHGNDLRSPWDW